MWCPVEITKTIQTKNSILFSLCFTFPLSSCIILYVYISGVYVERSNWVPETNISFKLWYYYSYYTDRLCTYIFTPFGLFTHCRLPPRNKIAVCYIIISPWRAFLEKIIRIIIIFSCAHVRNVNISQIL